MTITAPPSASASTPCAPGPGAHRTPGPRTRWHTLTLLAAMVLVAAAAAASAVVIRWVTADSRRDYLAADGWPSHGQAAYALGAGAPRPGPGQRPAPIASMAKVMTAWLVLRAAPLRNGADGPSLTVTAADVADTAARRARGESVVAVRAGERLSERQALLAVLLPSANNVARMVTRLVAPGVAAFVRLMNREAARLGMRHTVYTDPSGFDDRTVSTSTDQLRLARVAGTDATLAAMMATPSARIPVAGRIENTDLLLGHDGFVGMKTGSDDAAGGCFMFHARRAVDGRVVDVWGVVMGQPGRHLLLTGQYAARQLVARVTG